MNNLCLIPLLSCPKKTVMINFFKCFFSNFAGGFEMFELTGIGSENYDAFSFLMPGQDMEEDIIDDSSLSKELSLVTLDAEEDVPSACILCRKDRQNIAIIYLVNFSKDPFQLVDLMRVLTDRIKKKDYTDNDLVFVTMDDYMRKLPETLLGGDDLLESRGRTLRTAKFPTKRPEGHG